MKKTETGLACFFFFPNILAQSFWIAQIGNQISRLLLLASWSSMSVSADEVAKHNTDKDCWVIVGDQVLDVTEFLSDLAYHKVVHLERHWT